MGHGLYMANDFDNVLLKELRNDLIKESTPMMMPFTLSFCMVYSILIPGLGFITGCGFSVFSPFTYTYARITDQKYGLID